MYEWRYLSVVRHEHNTVCCNAVSPISYGVAQFRLMSESEANFSAAKHSLHSLLLVAIKWKIISNTK